MSEGVVEVGVLLDRVSEQPGSIDAIKSIVDGEHTTAQLYGEFVRGESPTSGRTSFIL